MIYAAFKHQAIALQQSKDAVEYALFMEPRTGKTKVILETAAHLFRQGKIDTLFVLAPNGVHRHWLREAEKHMPEDVPWVGAFYRALRHKHFDEVAALPLGKTLRILTINIEALSRETGTLFCLKILKQCKALLVVDESQRIKTPSSSRTRNAWKLSRAAPYRRILTGTSVSQGLQDLYSQFRFLNPTIIGCQTYSEFRFRYCVEVGEFRRIVGYRNVQSLLDRLQPYTFTVLRKDCMDVPKTMTITREVDLSPEQERIYNSLRDEFVVELDKGVILEAPLILVRITRLLQVLAGHLPDPEGKSKPLPCPRIPQAIDIAEDAPGKTLIWARFRSDVEQLGQELGKREIGWVPYYGGVSSDQNAKNLERFKTDPSVRVFVGTPQKGGTGIPLDEASTVINYSHSWSFEHWEQSQARNQGPDQEREVTYFDLVAPGTIEEKVIAARRRKGGIAALLKDPATFRSWLSPAG